MSEENIYLLENRKVAWGDWGDILWEGLTIHDPQSGRMYIERTGPFTPMAYLSNNYFILTDSAKNLLERSALSGVTVDYEIEKRKIVKLNWQSWDYNKHITQYLDVIGCPEDIILQGVNDRVLFKEMPAYWLASIGKRLHLSIDKSLLSDEPSDYVFIDDGVKGEDFYLGVERSGVYVSQRARMWLKDNFPGCFTYHLISRK
ncbi:hypothetical protein [Klebsiella aerogenes]|uniref:hypothetical protein n=1 Tax=Klebsiella aerogenes TaxID=548 RepID=UPI0022798FBE|nr:hypothetical protein [Klebsiella aerogenes]MCY4764677.1 hypothetical protein [Klebsiella aerogenes]